MATSEAVELRELGVLYEDVRRRIVGLVRDLDDVEAAKPVPACPAWSVKDLISHVAGNCTSIITGELDGLATEAWTQQQVDSRRHLSLAEVLDEWDRTAPQVTPLVDDFPGRYGAQFIGDLTVHEHDFRGALEKPGARNSDAIRISLDFMVAGFLSPAATMFGLGPLEVKAGDKTWIIGTGETATGDSDQRSAWQTAVAASESDQGSSLEPVARLDVAGFDLFRAITGRRSANQIKSWNWSVDPEPYLPIFDFDPFTIRADDLIE